MKKSLAHPRYKILNWIWKLNVFPKIKVFILLTIREALPTCEFLIDRRLEITKSCYMYNQSGENSDHIFKSCPFIESIWDHIKYNCSTPLFYEGNFLSWLELVYKNYKTHCKIFKQPMEKIVIILWSI